MSKFINSKIELQTKLADTNETYESTSPTNMRTMSYGQLFIVLGICFLFIFALVGRIIFDNRPPANPSLYLIRSNQITGFIGSDEEITIPSTYSLEGITEEEVTKTFNSNYEAYIFFNDELNSDYDTYYDFYSYFNDYNTEYPFTTTIVKYNYSYIVGEDCQITTIGYEAFKDNKNLRKVYISEGITRIDAFAFDGCSNLEEVVFPDSLELISTMAFQNSGLKTLNLPPNVTDIQSYTFWGCKFETLEIPETITYISPGAFWRCQNLTSVKFLGDELIRTDYYNYYSVFGECNSLSKIYVKQHLVNEYKTTYGWHFWADLFVGY